ncbi:IucA/IucC family protein [Spongiactinospora sp. TRM90649]|uniref:IucA/IucC family protein n=1 Tax=Spongiactinospora sp. TRM90649 TaxID=3031114 RepID=UPI0023F98B88|nr:IucA/IucC family protein [Spongiactinospora sp. TRM90649]MDF5755520.1 IucA/IucC family protein [Spongiactinospora sp. TRM90649]
MNSLLSPDVPRAEDSPGRARHRATAEEATVAALLRCCLREIAGPRGEVWDGPPYTFLRLAGTLIRARVRGGMALRFAEPPAWLEDGAWRPLTSALLVRLVQAGLSKNDDGNDEFGGQVAASRDAITRILAARERAAPPAGPWLASEQALTIGHPFHPSPKARDATGWLRYAPEAHATFPLRLLGVRHDVLLSGGDTTALDKLDAGAATPPGYTLLPAHPWQLDLLAADLAAPLADGRLVDLGHGSRPVVPTSSVRTVHEPVSGMCLKFSLDVRITNCVRKNAWYELEGAVALSERLEPVFGALATRFPGTGWLPEPGFRSAALGTRLLEGLGVILRASPSPTALLAAALAAATALPAMVAERQAAEPVRWWAAYVRHVALPALDAFCAHGVVLEAHLQNVLVKTAPDGMPSGAVFRDLEGAKLVAGRHDLAGVPGPVAGALTYTADQGWNRVAYCLLVNHLPEIAATIAGRAGDDGDRLLAELWGVAWDELAAYARSREWPARMRDLLSGVPLPAKANLSVRWSRAADRAAGYVPVANPLAGRDGDGIMEVAG